MVKLFKSKSRKGKSSKGERGDVQGVPDLPTPATKIPPPQESYGNVRQSQSARAPQQQPVATTTTYRSAAPGSQPSAMRSQQSARAPPPAVSSRPPPPAVSPSIRQQQQQQQPPPGAAYQSTSHLPTNNADVTRDVVKKFIADIWNRGDLDLIPEVCHRSLRFNGSVGMDRVGHDGFARMVQTIRDALSDYHCEIHSMVVEGNKAFVRMRFTGRHTGALLGFEPTGRQVAWMGASEFTIKDGKILKVWELGDVKSLEQQLYPEDEM